MGGEGGDGGGGLALAVAAGGVHLWDEKEKSNSPFWVKCVLKLN